MSWQQAPEYASWIVQQLEGPYKWHIIIGALLILTGLITRFIFNSVKWLLLLILIGGTLIGAFMLLTKLANL